MLRDNKGRARMARLVLILLMLNNIILLITSITGQLKPDWANAATAVSWRLTAAIYYSYALLSFCYIVLVIVSYITLILWFRRAYYNLHQLPGIHPEYSDGWAAGAWFVPFVNFVRPYTIMREIWQDTQRAALGHVAEPSTLLSWWWTAFILKLIIARISWYVGNDGHTGLSQADLLGTTIDTSAQFISAAFTWYIIGRCVKFEEQLIVRQQIDQLGQSAVLSNTQVQTEQSNYALEEGY
jgi:hypothetical protein